MLNEKEKTLFKRVRKYIATCTEFLHRFLGHSKAIAFPFLFQKPSYFEKEYNLILVYLESGTKETYFYFCTLTLVFILFVRNGKKALDKDFAYHE